MAPCGPADLAQLLTLERLECNLFRGLSRQDGLPQLFGGQVIAQALLAASATVEPERWPSSLHAYFLRPGNAAQPIVYEVERPRDGSSFANRNVQAIQNGEVILSMMASFKRPEVGYERHPAMPAVPPPEALTPARALYEAWLAGPQTAHAGMLPLYALAERVGIEIRPVADGGGAAVQHLWLRCAACSAEDPRLHWAALAYASDFGLLGTAKRPHDGYFSQPDMINASLDHALWFHRPLRMDDWLLYSMDSPAAYGARAYARGLLFDRHGVLIASVAQEGLMRSRRRNP